MNILSIDTQVASKDGIRNPAYAWYKCKRLENGLWQVNYHADYVKSEEFLVEDSELWSRLAAHQSSYETYLAYAGPVHFKK